MTRGGDPHYWAVHPQTTLMPTTEAGKRLLASNWTSLPMSDDFFDMNEAIAAIEAEAVAAERARIRAAVEEMALLHTHGVAVGPITMRPEEVRAAVLRIIDGADPAANRRPSSAGGRGMNDRDRLAADLAKTELCEHCGSYKHAAEDLTALGWTRLDEETRLDICDALGVAIAAHAEMEVNKERWRAILAALREGDR